jgi:hypothetical protein
MNSRRLIFAAPSLKIGIISTYSSRLEAAGRRSHVRFADGISNAKRLGGRYVDRARFARWPKAIGPAALTGWVLPFSNRTDTRSTN